MNTNEEKPVTVAIHLPKQLHQELKYLARDRGVLFSSFIMDIFHTGMDTLQIQDKTQNKDD